MMLSELSVFIRKLESELSEVSAKLIDLSDESDRISKELRETNDRHYDLGRRINVLKEIEAEEIAKDKAITDSSEFLQGHVHKVGFIDENGCPKYGHSFGAGILSHNSPMVSPSPLTHTHGLAHTSPIADLSSLKHDYGLSHVHTVTAGQINTTRKEDK